MQDIERLAYNHMSIKRKIIHALQKNLPNFKMIDEFALMQAADQLLSQLNGIDHTIIHQLTRDHGCDFSTAVLFSHFKQNNKTFIDTINHLSIQQSPTNYPQTFIIVPALLHDMYPAMGGKGELFGDICQKLGHHVYYLDTNGGKTVFETSKQIKSLTARHESVWLISISRGARDVLHYFSQYQTKPKNIMGWLNIGGLINGTPLSDHMLSTALKRFKTNLICQACDVDFSAIYDLKTQKRSQIHQIPFIRQLKLIHMVGFPLRSHVPPYLSSRYLKLAREAPNDAMLYLTDYIDCPGDIYPLWGCDHFFRLPNLSILIYQLMSYLQGLMTYVQSNQQCFNHNR